jgi:predicted transcriptional regulator of viral defense system
MKYFELRKLKSKLFFTLEDLQDLLGIKIESARVLCTRYTEKGIFIRLKKNFYVLTESWEAFLNEDFLKLSNFLQVPSYVSFTTALSFYEITTQLQRNFFESASVKRSIRFNTKGTVFNYYKIQKKYFFDFIKKGEIFIATKEKAFIDSVYLYSFGKYKMDFSSIDIARLNKKKIKELSGIYPEKTRGIIKRLCRN